MDRVPRWGLERMGPLRLLQLPAVDRGFRMAGSAEIAVLPSQKIRPVSEVDQE